MSLSELHSNVENGAVVHAREPCQKMELQHTTTVWYDGSCTNKHDKRCHARYITKKVDINTHGHRLLCSLNFIYCTPQRCSSCCTVHRHSAALGLPRNAVASV